MELSGAVAVVTGSARGLGKSIAETFAAKGVHVALVDVLEHPLQESAAEIRATGAHALPIVADITDPTQVSVMADTVSSELGPVDILVNNAGTFSVIGPVWEVDPEKWLRDIRVILCGSFLVCNAVLKEMVERRVGYVINIVSSGGVGDPHPYSTSYASSKTGLMRLTEGLAKETQEHNVKVFAVGPPAIRTEMTRFIATDTAGKKWRPGFSDLFDEGRDTPPELVANFLIDLLSGRADRLTGRFFNPKQNFEQIIEQIDDILENDLYTLRIRGK